MGKDYFGDIYNWFNRVYYFKCLNIIFMLIKIIYIIIYIDLNILFISKKINTNCNYSHNCQYNAYGKRNFSTFSPF